MILHNFQLRKSNVRRFLGQPFWCCYYHSTLLVPSFSAKKWVDRQFYCLWTKRRDGGKTGSERLFPPQIGLGPWISPRVLLRQTESNNLEKQRRSNQSHEKKKHKQKSSKYLVSDWNKHLNLRGSRLGHPHCTAVIPTLALALAFFVLILTPSCQPPGTWAKFSSASEE